MSRRVRPASLRWLLETSGGGVQYYRVKDTRKKRKGSVRKGQATSIKYEWDCPIETEIDRRNLGHGEVDSVEHGDELTSAEKGRGVRRAVGRPSARGWF
jgi:hypothetical protein